VSDAAWASPEAGTPADDYREAGERHERERREAHRASVRLSTIRALTFVAAAGGFLAWDVLEGTAAWVGFGVGVVLVLVFFAEISVHRRARRREAWAGALEGLSREGLHRLARDWNALDDALPEAERRWRSAAPEHGYARDLDVLGRASLVRILGPVTSEGGRARLRAWLLEAGGPEEVAERQVAVRELAPRRALRHDFAAHGRLETPAGEGALEPFLGWAEGEPWLAGRTLLVWAARILPPLTLGLGAADLLAGWEPWWLIPAVAQAWVLSRTSGPLRAELAQAESGASLLPAYAGQISLLEGESWTAPRLRGLADALEEPDGEQASTILDRLAGLLDTVQSRRNMFWAALVIILLLDVHLAGRLDAWRRAHGSSVRRWLGALAEWEALSSLATVAHDHPTWSWPELHPPQEGTPIRLEAEGLGHPLLADADCVRNDVTLGPPGSFLLVTGSNMSGKSTLLRALGTNAVLAQAGGPVCASGIRMPSLRVRTSMRIDDSLAQGVSLFMAELLRVREIVRAAEEPGPPVLYLLDEILHGTNTAERRVAARGIVRHLLEAGAIGAVSTHDLTLARSPELEAAAVPVHFREEMEEAQDAGPDGRRTLLRFDYTLRQGLATTRNALKLLEAVGLGGLELEEEDDPQPPPAPPSTP